MSTCLVTAQLSTRLLANSASAPASRSLRPNASKQTCDTACDRLQWATEARATLESTTTTTTTTTMSTCRRHVVDQRAPTELPTQRTTSWTHTATREGLAESSQMSTLNDSFEAIAIDDDDDDDNNNNNTATTNSGPVDSDDENVATPAPPTQTPNTAAETNVDPDVIPLVFLRGGSVPLCVLHQRVATSAKLCSRFAEIRCVDATCQAASYMAKSEVNEIGAKLPPLIRCRFHGNGCPVEQLLHLRAQHEVRCAYRPIVGDDDDDDDDAALLNEFAVVGPREAGAGGARKGANVSRARS
jgi:hypothetical protein